jgi:hypothetical protein
MNYGSLVCESTPLFVDNESAKVLDWKILTWDMNSFNCLWHLKICGHREVQPAIARIPTLVNPSGGTTDDRGKAVIKSERSELHFSDICSSVDKCG